MKNTQLEDIAHLEQEYFESGFRQNKATHMTLFYYGVELIGKIEFHFEDDGIHVDWFLAPGYGKVCWESFSNNWKPRAIHLVCVANPNESTETVVRRFNFYFNTIGGFHVQNVQYDGGAARFLLYKEI